MTCTYTNTQPKLRVSKEVVNACAGDVNDTGKFNLRIAGNTVVTDAQDGDESTPQFVPFNVAQTVDETAGTGTTLSDYTSTVGCAANSGSFTTGANGDTTIPVTLTSGNADVGCTFTNVRKGKVTVTKFLSPTTDSGRFDLLVSGTPVATNIGNGGTGSVLVAAGTSVTVGEVGNGTILTDYNIFITCTNGETSNSSTSGSFTVRSGDDITCRIYNNRKISGLSCLQ